MAKTNYKVIQLDEYSYVERKDSDGKIWSIPMDETNSDYQAYLASQNEATSKPVSPDA
jgi:hypothetical protein